MEGVDGAEGQYFFVPEGEGGAEFNKEIAGMEGDHFSFIAPSSDSVALHVQMRQQYKVRRDSTRLHPPLQPPWFHCLSHIKQWLTNHDRNCVIESFFKFQTVACNIIKQGQQP